MEIRPHIVQNKTDSGTCSFSSNRAQAQKQCLDLAPFNIAVNWLCEDRLKRFSVLAVHKTNDSELCYHVKFKMIADFNVQRRSSGYDAREVV